MKYSALMLPAALAACMMPQEQKTSSVPMTYACENEQISVIFNEDQAILDREDGRVTLPNAVSGSGARYADGDIEFHEKAGEAILVADGIEQPCQLVSFIAGGNEPFWAVEKEFGLLTFTRPDAAPETVTITSEEKTPTGWTFAGEGMSLAIIDQRCNDTMADRSYPFTATLTQGDMVWNGCAGAWFGDDQV